MWLSPHMDCIVWFIRFIVKIRQPVFSWRLSLSLCQQSHTGSPKAYIHTWWPCICKNWSPIGTDLGMTLTNDVTHFLIVWSSACRMKSSPNAVWHLQIYCYSCTAYARCWTDKRVCHKYEAILHEPPDKLLGPLSLTVLSSFAMLASSLFLVWWLKASMTGQGKCCRLEICWSQQKSYVSLHSFCIGLSCPAANFRFSCWLAHRSESIKSMWKFNYDP